MEEDAGRVLAGVTPPSAQAGTICLRGRSISACAPAAATRPKEAARGRTRNEAAARPLSALPPRLRGNLSRAGHTCSATLHLACGMLWKLEEGSHSMRTADTFPGYSPDDLLGPLNDVERENAPERLYVAGAPSLLKLGTRVSIVGSRKASPIGLQRARRLARILAEHDVIVVSGLAEGIDTAAHERR